MTRTGWAQDFVERQLNELRAITDRISTAFAGRPEVAAIWLYGSLGRGDGDHLSDVDLVLVAAPEHVADLVASVRDRLDAGGDVALVHKAPQNAPADGTQLNVLYDTEPLPIFVDWTVWPHIGERPDDVSPIFEASPMTDAGRPLSAMAEDRPRGQNTPLAERLDGFRTFMVPHLVKHAARGNHDSFAAIAHHIQIPGEPPQDFDEAITVARSILAGSRPSDRARRTIERYIRVLEETR